MDNLGKFVFNNGGSIPRNVFPEFRGQLKKDPNCPNCGSYSKENFVTINTTDLIDEMWIEHCICKACGKFHGFWNEV